jgi:hypothetical protein
MALQFNPGNEDKSGQILGAHQISAANTRQQGKMALAQGIASGVTSVAEGALGALSNYTQQGEIAGIAQTKIKAAQEFGQQYGMDMSFMDELLKDTKNPAQLNAMADIALMHLGQGMKNSYGREQHNMSMQRMAAQSQMAGANQMGGIYGRADAAAPPNMRPVAPAPAGPPQGFAPNFSVIP